VTRSTNDAVVLLMGDSDADPLILQVKEARASVLEPFAGASPYENHGRRVVAGQHLTQAASDLFLGWTRLVCATTTSASCATSRARSR
jgi:hypothetical protein